MLSRFASCPICFLFCMARNIVFKLHQLQIYAGVKFNWLARCLGISLGQVAVRANKVSFLNFTCMTQSDFHLTK
ncbi:hypothetical protein Plhal710r2_c016g0072341 [Plasmopara halstedii]